MERVENCRGRRDIAIQYKLAEVPAWVAGIPKISTGIEAYAQRRIRREDTELIDVGANPRIGRERECDSVAARRIIIAKGEFDVPSDVLREVDLAPYRAILIGGVAGEIIIIAARSVRIAKNRYRGIQRRVGHEFNLCAGTAA